MIGTDCRSRASSRCTDDTGHLPAEGVMGKRMLPHLLCTGERRVAQIRVGYSEYAQNVAYLSSGTAEGRQPATRWGKSSLRTVKRGGAESVLAMASVTRSQPNNPASCRDERALRSATDRADPGIRELVKRCSCGDLSRITDGGVVDVPADRADVFLHAYHRNGLYVSNLLPLY